VLSAAQHPKATVQQKNLVERDIYILTYTFASTVQARYFYLTSWPWPSITHGIRAAPPDFETD
jgi:hypothetical protein